MKKNLKGKITNIETVAKDTIKLEFESNLQGIQPGEFLSILCPPKTLRRPFSVAGFRKTALGGILTVLIKLKGDGTNYLNSLKIGADIDFLAPLGIGFDLSDKRALLVGAGIGIAPVLYLKDILNQKKVENLLVTGFRTEEDVINGSDKEIIGGSVLDALPEIILNFKPEVIYTCGPHIVLEKIAEMGVKYGIETQVAMEKVMACGIGVCRGCVIKLKSLEGDKNEVTNATICKDGPVFKGNEVIWN